MEIKPSILRGSITAPPSKSIAHRALICAALSEGETTISNYYTCADTKATADALIKMGAEISVCGSTCVVKGFGGKPKSCSVYCNESGSTLRFLIPLCLNGEEFVFSGAERLLERPLSVYEDICKNERITFLRREDGIFVKGKLSGGEFNVKGDISSQFITGLLFALSLCKEDSVINLIPPVQSKPYIDLTIDTMRAFGVEGISFEDNKICIKGNNTYRAADYTIEGDCSNAAFLEALNVLGSEVDVKGVNENTLQGDFVYRKHFESIKKGTPIISLADCPDLGPVLMAAAAANNGAVFTETERLKIKESDRGDAMKRELLKFGVNVEIGNNKITVKAGVRKPTEILSSHNDHRIVMSLALLCLITGGEIEGYLAVNKSYPQFFGDICSLGAKVKFYEDE